jgi:nicotinamidase-related amidase
MEYEPENTAVIVVDCQNDFCHPDGELYAEGSEAAIDGVDDVLTTTYDKGVNKAVFTQDTHQPGDPEFEQWGEHCLDGSWGQAIHQDIAVDPSVCPIVQKDTYDAFYKTPMDEILTTSEIEQLIICGTLANVCVQETASSASLHGYDVAVVEDAVGYISEEQKERALNHIDFLIGDIISTEDL